MKQTIVVSACLLGAACRYDGQSKGGGAMDALLDRYHAVPLCPEQLGGLPTPRPPAERQPDGAVRTGEGRDVTTEYRRGAEEALALAKKLGAVAAVLKERSPSCGSGQIYDGSFSGRLIPGDGTAAELFQASGIPVFGESQIEELLL